MKKLIKVSMFALLVVCSTGNSFGMEKENCSKKTQEVGSVASKFKFLRAFKLSENNDSSGSYNISGDGKYVVCGDDSGFVRVYDIKGKNSIEIFSHKNPNGIVRSVHLSSDGRYVVFLSDRRIVKIFNIKTKKEVFSYTYNYFTDSDDFIVEVCLSRDGEYITSCDSRGCVKVYDKKRKEEVCSYNHSCFDCYYDSVSCLCFNRNGKYVMSVTTCGEVKKLKKRKEVYSRNFKFDVYSACFSQNGKSVVFGERNGKVKICDIKNKKEIFSYGHEGCTSCKYSAYVSCLCFSPDGNFIASGGNNKIVRVYDIKNKKEVFAYNHASKVENVRFSSNDKKLISVDSSGQVSLYETSDDFRERQEFYKNKFRKKDFDERINYIVGNM